MFFLTYDDRSAMDCTVTLYIQRCLSSYLNIAWRGYAKLLENVFGGPGKFVYCLKVEE